MSETKLERQPRHLTADEPVSLDELVVTANREHEFCEQHARSALEHAIAAGAALATARTLVAAGEWSRWLALNFKGNIDEGRLYIRLFTYREQLPAGSSISSAKRLLVGEARANERASEYPVEVRETVVELANQGVAAATIARAVDAPPATVRYWIDPKQGERIKKSAQRQRDARAALREKERQRAIRKAVRKAGAALAEAYSMSSRMAAVLAQAEEEATKPATRVALEDAQEHYHKMSDAIVRALGVA